MAVCGVNNDWITCQDRADRIRRADSKPASGWFSKATRGLQIATFISIARTICFTIATNPKG
jgi:hypothetical protein